MYRRRPRLLPHPKVTFFFFSTLCPVLGRTLPMYHSSYHICLGHNRFQMTAKMSITFLSVSTMLHEKSMKCFLVPKKHYLSTILFSKITVCVRVKITSAFIFIFSNCTHLKSFGEIINN